MSTASSVQPPRLEVLGSVLILLASGVVALAQDKQPFNERPAEATIVMSTSRGKYDGTYSANLVARTCGVVPAELNFAGVPAFIVHFYPDDGQGSIRDITFDSKELVERVTTSTKFLLSVGVQSPKIGSPAAYVLDTAAATRKMSGSAVLTTPSAGALQLKVNGVNDLGETVDLTIVCKPRK